MDYINDNNLIDFTKCDVEIDYPNRIDYNTTIDVTVDEKYIPSDELISIEEITDHPNHPIKEIVWVDHRTSHKKVNK